MLSSQSAKFRFLVLGALGTIVTCVLILVLRDGWSQPRNTEAERRTSPVKGNAPPNGVSDAPLAGKSDQNSAAGITKNADSKGHPVADPSTHERMKANLAVSLQNAYGGLFLENGLSAEQSDEVCSLMVAQQMDMLNLLRPRPGESPPPIQEVERLRTSQQDQLREKLGEKAFAALNQFNRDRSASRVVSRLEESARSSGVTFSSEQLEQVRSVLAKERVSKTDLTNLPPMDFATLRANQAGSPGPPPISPQNPVVQEVRSILSPEQVLLLEKVLKTRPPRPSANR